MKAHPGWFASPLYRYDPYDPVHVAVVCMNGMHARTCGGMTVLSRLSDLHANMHDLTIHENRCAHGQFLLNFMCIRSLPFAICMYIIACCIHESNCHNIIGGRFWQSQLAQIGSKYFTERTRAP